MPGQGFSIGGDFGATLVDLVNEGVVPVERVNDMVLRSVDLRVWRPCPESQPTVDRPRPFSHHQDLDAVLSSRARQGLP